MRDLAMTERSNQECGWGGGSQLKSVATFPTICSHFIGDQSQLIFHGKLDHLQGLSWRPKQVFLSQTMVFSLL